VVSILDKMPVDEVADVLGDLQPERAQEILRLLKPRKSEEVRELLKQEEDTAGGLMTTEFISITKDLTVEQTIQKLRELAPDAETVYYLYVTDESGKLVGVLSLRTLIIAPPSRVISEIMERDLITVDESVDQRQVADVISKYNLLAVPVVDKTHKMSGIVTVDDVIDFVLPPLSRRKRHMLG
jgi:Mg/Co/Ni transporter MgtE